MGLFKSLLSSSATGLLRKVRTYQKFENVKDIAPNKIGVYIFRLDGDVVYVGRAIEDRPGQHTKGLRKRLQEHWRGAANCKPEIYQYRNDLTVEMKICPTISEAKGLEASLIRKYKTVTNGWNLRYED